MKEKEREKCYICKDYTGNMSSIGYALRERERERKRGERYYICKDYTGNMSSIGYALRERERKRKRRERCYICKDYGQYVKHRVCSERKERERQREGGESDGTFVKITDDVSSIVYDQGEERERESCTNYETSHLLSKFLDIYNC